jgi:hypothetical protein
MENSPEKEEAIYAEIGRVTTASGGIDNNLVMLLGQLITRSGSLAYPSIFIFSARSMDQRQEIVLKYFRVRCVEQLSEPRTSNHRRAAEFAEKIMTTIFSSITKNKWVRNLAAHGNLLWEDGEPHLIPPMFDLDAQERLKNRSPTYASGLTLHQLREARLLIKADGSRLGKLSVCLAQLLQWKRYPAEFLETANALARDLKMSTLRLQDPSEGPPLRKSKRNRRK